MRSPCRPGSLHTVSQPVNRYDAPPHSKAFSCGVPRPVVSHRPFRSHRAPELRQSLFRSVLYDGSLFLKEPNVRKIWLCAAAVLFAGGLVNVGTPSADATLCGSIGGRFVDVTGCSDPLSYLNDALPAAATSTAATTAGRRRPATSTTGLLRAATAERRRVCQHGQAYQRQWLHLASA